MPGTHLKVVVTRKLPEPVETRLSELFDVTLNETDALMDRKQLADALREADVLIPTICDQIDSRLIAGAGDQLKLIANYGAGFDHIDVQSALSHGVMVSNTPGVSADDTADIAMALILATPRRLKEGAAIMQSGTWAGWSPTAMMGHRIGGKRFRHFGHGTYRAGGRAEGSRVWIANPLPQPQAHPPRYRR